MLHRILAFLRRRRVTDILHRQRLQFECLHRDLRDVQAAFKRGDITIEDLGQE